MNEDHCIGNTSREFCYNWRKEKLNYQLRLCEMLIKENVRNTFKLKDDFGQVIEKKKKSMLIFYSSLGLILIELKRSNKKLSLKNFLYFPRIPCILSFN